MAIKTMSRDLVEQSVKDVELSEKITAEPMCNIHQTRMVSNSIEVFCPVCKEQRRLRSTADGSMILL